MLNPDSLGRAYSVAVRVYQLKDPQRFKNASYDDLLISDKTLLAQDLLDEHGVMIYPGGSASVSQPVKPDTQYVGIVAFYRDAKSDGSWRLVVPKRDLSADTPLALELVDDAVMLSKDAPPVAPAASR